MPTRPIRIVHIMPQIGIGGAENQLRMLIAGSDEQVVSHDVLYYSDSFDTEGFRLYREAGVSLSRVPRSKKRPVKFLHDLAAAIKSRDPDIVHCWLFSGTIWGRWGAMRAGCKNIVLSYRSSYLGYPKTTAWIDRLSRCLSSANVHYLACSLACANAIAKQLRLPPSLFHVIYNGIDTNRFDAPAGDCHQRLLNQLGIADDKTVITMVGRLTRAKNYETVLNVAQRSRENGLSLHFLIVGHGEEEARLKNLARELDVQQMVHFLGLRTDIAEILCASDIFLFTSLWEGLPNTLLEAMAAGLPIVSTNFAAVDELIDNGENGTIVPMRDVNHIYAAVNNYLQNPDRARVFGEQARIKARQRFSIEQMVQNVMQFYGTIMGRQGQ